MSEKGNLNKCKNCRSYCAFYVKYLFCFGRADNGMCTLRQKYVKRNDICEYYKRRAETEKNVTLEDIDAVIEDIEYLEKLFYDFDD